ncbi:MAG: TetR/AcrR family transcriptional regulator [Bacteroidetes bacterium]|nr:TetR/AcrR family transcriptional regulator [Bacteroidota bacterium]
MNKHKSKKYIQIVQTSLELFRNYGIKKISVEEICKKSGVSKMTFYKFFKNKADLVDQVWCKAFDDGMTQFEEIENMEAPFTTKVQLLLKLKEENTKKLGPQFAKEYVDMIPEFMEKYSLQYQKSMERFIDFIKVHQESGEVRAEMRPDFFLKAIAKLMELTQDRELVESYSSIKDFAMEVNNFMYYGIMPAPKLMNEKNNEE